MIPTKCCILSDGKINATLLQLDTRRWRLVELSTLPGLINDAMQRPHHSHHPAKMSGILLLIARLLMQRHALLANGFWLPMMLLLLLVVPPPAGNGIKSDEAATGAGSGCRQWVAIKRSYRLTNIRQQKRVCTTTMSVSESLDKTWR